MNMILDLGLFRQSRVRPVRQTEAAECGLACLNMVASYHGLDIDLGTLRREFASSSRGATLKSLIATADRIGLSSRAVQLPLEELPHLHMPAILHWNMSHYVVVERTRRNKALIHNPDGRSRWYPFAELSKHFTGIALELRPGSDFEPAQRRERLRLSQLWHKITGLKRALVQILVLTLVMQAFVLAAPYYMQLAIDQALPALDMDLLAVLALGFALFTLVNVAASLLRSFVLLSAGVSLSYGVATNVARRLFRLPVAWFEKRHVGDILSRFQSISPIQKALTEGMVAAVLDGSLAILTLAVMFAYSFSLAMVALSAFGLYVLVRLLSFSAQRDAQEESIINRAREQSMLMESVRGMITLRLFGSEGDRHAHWQAKLTDAVNAEVGFGRISAWQSCAHSLIFGLEIVVSVWLATSLAIEGGFSVGMVFAYIAYKTQFLTNSASLIDNVIAFRMLGLHLDRLSDIALADQDLSFDQVRPPRREFSGGVVLTSIAYRYSPNDPLVLRDIRLSVAPGDHVAITGMSGGGKSTLVKIVLGLLEPTQGELILDGMPLARFGHANYHGQVGAVLQEDNLFAGSLADNIALFDHSPDVGRIMDAARAASIHDDILAMPMQYETLVGDMGSTLSGGQRQRVLLARALYRRPKLLVIDEGTSHLDSVHECAVNQAIAAMGITRIVIAHRQETIRAADIIYVLEDGILVPSG